MNMYEENHFISDPKFTKVHASGSGTLHKGEWIALTSPQKYPDLMDSTTGPGKME